MTGRLSKNFHGVGIGPLSKILAVKTLLEFFALEHNAYKAKHFRSVLRPDFVDIL